MAKIKIGEQCPANRTIKAGSQFCKERCPWFLSAERTTVECEREIIKQGVMYNDVQRRI